MADWVIVIALVVALAGFVTVHVALSGVLVLFHRPRWQGLVALVVPPVAPVFGFRAGRSRLAFAWIVLLVIYAAARIAAWIMS